MAKMIKLWSTRKCWQLTTDKFTIENKTEWDAALKQIVDSIKVDLIPGSPHVEVEARLDKVLIYDAGSFFKTHVDTPRGSTHFGSLVIVPPCKHVGGDLIVRHNGEEKTFNFSTSSKKASTYVAFFTDCAHEITTMTKGYRTSLTCNLFRPEKITVSPPAATSQHPVVLVVRKILAAKGEKLPAEIGILLKQKYSISAMKPATLKGVDRLIYSILESQFKDITRISR
eukprot:TRINITY_DN8043_c0_g1_i1.p1 TRINITY_DN8043_c0_g1~~TRINITY_DN8043_c0_g1_i1.p1  ORF type:complete len:227 (-),score=35.64 TRINITY_DN8043_c0_g1_i1:487-1167(-)